MAWLPPQLTGMGCLCLHPTTSLNPCPNSGFAPGRQQPCFPLVCTAENTVLSGTVGLALPVLALTQGCRGKGLEKAPGCSG